MAGVWVYRLLLVFVVASPWVSPSGPGWGRVIFAACWVAALVALVIRGSRDIDVHEQPPGRDRCRRPRSSR